MRDGVHDFDANTSNNRIDDRSFPDSGVSAGVEFGLNSVEKIKLGNIEPEQETVNSVFKQGAREYPASESKNGKSFKWKM
jgi:hypothetical protein